MEAEHLFKMASGIRLNIDMGSRIRFHLEGVKEPIPGTLVGMEPREYLIIKPNLPAELSGEVTRGTPLSVRYLSLGNEYGFTATILEQITSPDRLLFVSYPDTVENIDIRKSSRVSCFIPATALLEGRKLKGTITDISRGGCRFIIRLPATLQPRQIRLIDELTLKFPLMGIEGTQLVTCRVRNTSIDRERIAMGMEFVTADASLTHSIETYIAHVVEIQKEE